MLISWYAEAWIWYKQGGLWVAIHNGQIHGLYKSWMYKCKELPTPPLPPLSLSISCMCVCVCTHTGLFEMIVGVLTTCHTYYTWDRSICVCLFNWTTLQVFVTHLTGALYVHPFRNWRYESELPLKPSMLRTVWNELNYRVDVCRIIKGGHIEHM